MNQEKIGRFIAACRKSKNLTQANLAEKLGITDRAISKWETGKGMPDSSIMLELCNELDISVNELLSGEKLEMENYKRNAEENLVAMKQSDERITCKLKMVQRTMMIGYGVLAVCAAIMFIYHLYLNYTDQNYNGELFSNMLPLCLLIVVLAASSSALMKFLDKYDIVKK